MVRKMISSLIGALYVLAPWLLDYPNKQSMMITYIVLGAILFLCSFLSLFNWPKKTTLYHSISIFIGVVAMIYSGSLNLKPGDFFVNIILGLVAVFVNYSIVFPSDSE